MTNSYRGEVNRAYFDGLMARQGMSLRELGRRIESPHSKLSRVLNSEGVWFSLRECEGIASLFAEPLTKVLIEAGLIERPSGGVMVGAHLLGDGSVVPTQGNERLQPPDFVAASAIAVQARTLDSPLSYLDGWVFFCAKDHQAPASLLGRFCWIEPIEGPHLLGTVRRGYGQDTYNISGPATRSEVKILAARPVICIRT